MFFMSKTRQTIKLFEVDKVTLIEREAEQFLMEKYWLQIY